MIRWIIKILFKKDLEKIKEEYLTEGKEIVREAKEVNKVRYVLYERVPTDSVEFIYGIQPLFENKAFISWLSEHKIQWDQFSIDMVESGETEKGLMAIAKVSLINGLFKDLQTFKNQYQILIESKKHENGIQE